MSEPTPASEFKQLFCARVAIARHRAGYTQDSMAEALGMKQSKYHKYEKRSFLPHSFVAQFCTLCEISPQWLYVAAVDIGELAKAKPKAKKARRAA